MIQANWYLLFITALFPLILGYIWYHPKVLGSRLVEQRGLSVEQIGPLKNMGRIALIYLFGLLLSYMVTVLSIHQSGLFQLFLKDPQMADPNFEGRILLENFMEKYSNRHRTIGHGILHGMEAGFLFSLVLIGGTSLMEGKSMRNKWIHIWFWIVCSGLIGVLLCAYF